MFFCLLTILSLSLSKLDYTYYNEHIYVPINHEEVISQPYYYHFKREKEELKAYKVYTTSSSVISTTDCYHYDRIIPENIITKQIDGTNVVIYQQPLVYAPPKTVCKYCNGTGWINDYGNGELYTGTWYFYVNGYYDGHSCTNTEAYHDECDETTYGETYHHFYKTKCPFCNGTGYNGKANSNWTTWNGSGWTHLFTDNDGDGHCDDHGWHEIVPINDPPILAMLLFCIAFIIIKNKNDT